MDKPAIVTEDMLKFLDQLRDSGATNMFGAALYVKEAFDLSPTDARTVLTYWMKTFTERHVQEA